MFDELLSFDSTFFTFGLFTACIGLFYLYWLVVRLLSRWMDRKAVEGFMLKLLMWLFVGMVGFAMLTMLFSTFMIALEHGVKGVLLYFMILHGIGFVIWLVGYWIPRCEAKTAEEQERMQKEEV